MGRRERAKDRELGVRPRGERGRKLRLTVRRKGTWSSTVRGQWKTEEQCKYADHMVRLMRALFFGSAGILFFRPGRLTSSPSRAVAVKAGRVFSVSVPWRLRA